MQIRPARPDEADALTALAMRSKASWGYGAAFMHQVRADMIVSRSDIEQSHCLVAEDGGRLCGYVLTFINAEEALLRDLFIEPAYFGRRLGRKLFELAIANAKTKGARVLTLHSDPNAREFYEHLGMQCTGQVPSIVGHGRTLPVMELDLTE
jgi:GNAT superfamily N-acetyltransferase